MAAAGDHRGAGAPPLVGRAGEAAFGRAPRLLGGARPSAARAPGLGSGCMVLIVAPQSCLPVPEVLAVGGIGSVSEEEDIVSCLPKLRKTAGSASEVEEALKPAVKQE
uniref:Uncharacterized protein n=1 Tax=Oryza sativa subsp. japonica TaxID=39947 RepID=Q6EPB5_ORYSJ|nr:hypothetical protein [Oryza sativa Japonica Group]